MSFSDLNLNNPILNALQDAGLETPTDIQVKAFSPIMSGRDVVGIAQTGTGKTLAYLLPLLRMWKFVKDPHPRILILVPTRELTLQVKGEIDKLTTYMNVVTVAAFGGVNIKRQVEEITDGCDIVVATPGRLLDILYKKAINATYIKKLVIDEVDQMLLLGFRTQLQNILDILPFKRQNLMFSATMAEEVDALLDDFFKNPERIISAESGTPLDNISQASFAAPNFYTKLNLLKHIIADEQKFNKVIIFVNTKKRADFLFDLLKDNYTDAVGVIHSNKSQNYRLNSIQKFDEGEFRLLIATDILSRGIDLTEVSHVINFELPEEAESYIHRIGRTGRAEQEGKTISFVLPADEAIVKELEELMDYSIPRLNMPAAVEVSEELLMEEIETYTMPNIQLKNPVNRNSGGAFHEKKDKDRVKLTAREARLKRQKNRRDHMNSKKPKHKR